MTALAEPTRRAKKPRQSRIAAQFVYALVNARDLAAAPDRGGCRALDIDPEAGECFGPIERHHAGNTIGSRRVTEPDRVVCLCEAHHFRWAPRHNRAITEWLAAL